MKKVYPKLVFNGKFFDKIFKEKIIHSKSKGLDKQSPEGFKANSDENYNLIITKCLNQSYKFTPYLELLKLKGANSFPRTISIPCIRDRFVLYTLMEALHTKFPECVNRKLPNKYINDLKKFINKIEKPIHFIKVDIYKFYDSIDRSILLHILREGGLNEIFLSLIAKAIENPTIPPNINKKDHKKHKRQLGIPQGLPISNILAQIYLREFDNIILKRKFFYLRYVDDIILLNEGPITDFRIKNVGNALSNLKLEMNEDKTSSGELKGGFTYLSYKINKNNISISEKSIQIFIRRIAAKFTWYKNGIANKNRRAEWLNDDGRFKKVFIEELNEQITGSISKKKNYGWLFYFAEMNDISLLFKLDKIISSFFLQLQTFDNTAPNNLKRLARTYYVIKHGNEKRYLNNYDDYNTVRKKRNYLILRGALDPASKKSDMEINYLFDRYKNKKLRSLEKDVGYRYF